MDLEAPRPAPPGRRLTTVAYVIAWLSVVFYPLLLGPLAIVLAVLGGLRGDLHRGRRAAIVAACCMVAGLLLYWVLFPIAMENAPAQG